MTARQIEELAPGVETDAAIEAQVFGHGVALLEGGWQVCEEPANGLRKPRKFSTLPEEALKILDRNPEWQMWNDYGAIKASFSLGIANGEVRVNGIGVDQLFCMAICKAALMVEYHIKECVASIERRKKEKA